MIGKYGWSTVYSGGRCLNSLPSSLTEAQRRKFLEKACQGTGRETDIVHKLSVFLSDQCPSFIASLPKNSLEVLAPPVEDCYECGSRLVSYHACEVKLYTLSGV